VRFMQTPGSGIQPPAGQEVIASCREGEPGYSGDLRLADGPVELSSVAPQLPAIWRLRVSGKCPILPRVMDRFPANKGQAGTSNTLIVIEFNTTGKTQGLREAGCRATGPDRTVRP